MFYFSLWLINQKCAKLTHLGNQCTLEQCSTQGVQLYHTHKANSVFPGNVTTATGLEQFIGSSTQPDLGHLRKQSGTSPRSGPHYPIASAADGQIFYQVYSEEPAPTNPTSLGMANYQQAQIAKHANLPLMTGLEAVQL